MNSVTILGSINVDSILHIPVLPKPGETIRMTAFSQAAGGKGANQAVAAARSGAQVAFIGATGDDANAGFMRNQLAAAGVDLTAVATVAETATGQAYILLQASGQNSIVIQAGANETITAEQAVAAYHKTTFTVAECETPLAATQAIFAAARAAGSVTVLNPAPAQPLPQALLAVTDVIVPNETESEKLTGITTATAAGLAQNAAFFHAQGVQAVIITLGAAGAYLSLAKRATRVPAFAVTAVDTTAAGDTFIGALVAVLSPDLHNLPAAVEYASMASALAVQRLGALPSIPLRAEVTAALAAAHD
ncbi:ribokinase [Lacticaseibacillus parakribbianus]|uniref:ribokinase n=1 Tax=Lacticaseibacillus parakribbianus TaxID=2970927 RepID=UPI0021CB1130|nr:ribokinase [Lacticaseibacillus parakribbianus]